jgi:hypothetical protein
MTLRRGTAALLHNALITGFADAPYNIADASTVAQIDAGALALKNSILFDNANQNEPALAAEAGDDDDDGGYDDTLFATAADSANRYEDPQLGAPFDLAAPDFKPAAGSPRSPAAARRAPASTRRAPSWAASARPTGPPVGPISARIDGPVRPARACGRTPDRQRGVWRCRTSSPDTTKMACSARFVAWSAMRSRHFAANLTWTSRSMAARSALMRPRRSAAKSR